MKKLYRITFIMLSVALVCVSAIIWFSPYKLHDGDKLRAVKTTVEIDANVEHVFQYLGNSANAGRWSVYVHHITPLNDSLVKDGMPGSIRRCYTQADGQGITWDELTTIVTPNRMRQLDIYNMVGFSMSAPGLASQQLYKAVGANRTRLTFTLFYPERKPSRINMLKTYIAAYKVNDIFKSNMENIKSDIERNRGGKS